MKYPEYAEINGKKYKINTDYRIAIECQEIAYDEEIGEYERALAIIYKLFGDDALKDFKNHEKLMDIALKFLSCGKKIEESKEEPDMDFVQDMDYIEASFMSDYKIDITSTNIHWWKFFNLINGLSNSEFGDCCVLNRVRNLRNFDSKDIKDPKELEKIKKAKKQVELKKRTRPSMELSKEQKNNIDKFYEQMGIERRE
jgi:hypothetical protein